MKFLFAALLCLLLCGCTHQAEPVTEPPAETQAMQEKAVMYAPDHPMEKAYPGEVRAYPLTIRKVRTIRAMRKDVLTISGYGSTTFTVLTGEELYEAASLTLDFELPEKDPSLQIHEDGISFFDPQRLETLVLDGRLQEVRRIAAPPDLLGSPILSVDQSTLYYCTSRAVMAWNLESGVRRTVRELFYDNQELAALHLGDTVIHCRIQDGEESRNLLISADTGIELKGLPEKAVLNSSGFRYFAAVPAGFQMLLVFGEEDTAPEILYSRELPDASFYLPEDHAAITVHTGEEGLLLDYYELSTGILRSSLTLDTLQNPKAIVNSDGHAVYILCYDPAADCDILYRWDVLRQAPDSANVTDYTDVWYSRENPDRAALEDCRSYAAAIGEAYGITVRIGEEAAALEPWDYRFEAEYLAPVLYRELKYLQAQLARYPEGMLQQTLSHFSSLTISLVRTITGTADTGSLNQATGIQFLDGTDAHVVIAVGKYAPQSLCHELFHVMETHILTKSTALDQWTALNPAGFVYGNGYEVQEESKIYLSGETRAFVDSYSMSYPKEDRARVLEYAMLSGMEDTFRSEYMQRKLTALCRGIREAYDLEKLPQTLPWEQYLINPLAPAA